jgi:glycosyltransferase involved in cell wall biosynthesis
MKALIITESYLPKLGGVEKHIAGIKPYLEKAGFDWKIFDKSAILRNRPLRKFFGLLEIWMALFKKIKWIQEAEVIFIHDVFIFIYLLDFYFLRKKLSPLFTVGKKFIRFLSKIFYINNLPKIFLIVLLVSEAILINIIISKNQKTI